MQTKLHIIVAADRLGNIGVNNSIPWKLEGDLKRFKAVTMGHYVVVGRKTYISFKRALEGRTVIVVTRAADTNPDNIEKPFNGLFGEKIYKAPTLTEAIGCARRLAGYMDETPEVVNIFVAGGARLYKEAWTIADYLDLTVVANRPNVVYDTAIPDFNVNNWELDRTPMKVEQDIHGRGVTSLSHIHYHAKRVRAGTKKVLDTGRDLCWIFNERIGSHFINNEMDLIRDNAVDNEIIAASEATRPRHWQRPAESAPTDAWLKAALKEGFEQTPESERDYFNVWTKGGAGQVSDTLGGKNSIYHGEVIGILDKAMKEISGIKKNALDGFINDVVSRLQYTREVHGGVRANQDDASCIVATSRERISDAELSALLQLPDGMKALKPYLVQPEAKHLELLRNKHVLLIGWQDRVCENKLGSILGDIATRVTSVSGPTEILCGSSFPNYAEVIIYGPNTCNAFLDDAYHNRHRLSMMTEEFATGALKDFLKE